ncbi:QRFP-like peptide receptor [Oculina patagonica]
MGEFETLYNGSNGSAGDHSGLLQIRIPLNLQIGMTLAYVIIFIISLIGNLLLIYVTFKTSYLRTTTNLLVANMAVADLMITFFAMPYCVMYLFLQNIWISGIIGNVTCKIMQYLLALSIAASILTHALIAVDRFFCIVLPFKRRTFIKNSKISYSFIWCSSFVLMSPYLVVYGSVPIPDGNSYCTVKYEYMYTLQIYFCLVLVLLYVIPLLFIATLYTFVCRRLWKHKRPGIRSSTSVQRREVHNRKTVKMLIILVIAFALCWLPAHVIHLMTYFWYDEVLPHVVILLSFWACHSHSAINPLLVAFLGGSYRKAFREIFANRLQKNAVPLRKNTKETIS